tara:strand:- start:241 stop:468 length:228 start_codon:yes stop_codon:yes gene_type:complete
MLDKFKKNKKWIDKTVIFLYVVCLMQSLNRVHSYSPTNLMWGFHEMSGVKSFTLYATILFIAYWIFIGFKSKKDE